MHVNPLYMQKINSPLPNLVIIGGGFAGLEIIKGLANKQFRVTVIDKNNYFNFQPLMYQVASGGIGPDGIAYPLRKTIGKLKNVSFRLAEVIAVKPENNALETTIGEITYDYLCIATGAQSNFFGNVVLQKNCLELKSIPDALQIRNTILKRIEQALVCTNPLDQKALLTFVVVGGGPTGVETAGALAEIKGNVLTADYKELDASLMEVYLIEASPNVLASMSEISSVKAKQFLTKLGVKVLTNVAVNSFDKEIGRLDLNNNTSINTYTVIWGAGVKGKIINGLNEGTLGKGNRYLVNQVGLINGYSNIFAIGDVSLFLNDKNYPNGHPMIATVAQQQGKLLAKNLIHMQAGKPTKPFMYFDLGSMATVGRHLAVFEIFGVKMQGYLAWLGWMFLHLMLLVGFRNRVVVFVNWLWNYITYQRAIRLIIQAKSNED